MPGTPRHRDGETTPEKDVGPTFKEPHERDESAGSQARPQDELMKQAHADVEGGLVDTSKAEATDATYERHLRSPAPDEDKSASAGDGVGKSR